MSVNTEATRLLGIKHPILLAGMGRVSGAPLAAAVSNAGGLGTIGGIGYTPTTLREMITELKSLLTSPTLPFGVDLLLPQVGGSARPTNYDYTKGQLDELITVIIDSGAKLFVSAVGVPPKHVVDRLHAAGILYMNMIGHPKHVHKACAAGADLICAQGGEGAGIRGGANERADPCVRRYGEAVYVPLTGKAPLLVAAGGIADGRGVAAALMLGADAVWVGTRFVTAKEAGCPQRDKDLIVQADVDATLKSTIWTGRPLRHLKTPWTENWELRRREELEGLQRQGILAADHELDKLAREGKLTEEIEDQSHCRPAGVVAGLVNKPGQSAGEIVEEMSGEAYAVLRGASRMVGGQARL